MGTNTPEDARDTRQQIERKEPSLIGSSLSGPTQGVNRNAPATVLIPEVVCRVQFLHSHEEIRRIRHFQTEWDVQRDGPMGAYGHECGVDKVGRRQFVCVCSEGD